MFEKNFYTIRGMASELNLSEPAILHWYNRFEAWIPNTGRGKDKWFPREAMEVLKFIMESANSGMSEKDIEQALSHKYHTIIDPEPVVTASEEDNRMPTMSDAATATLFKALLENLSDNQERIAQAQERRAIAARWARPRAQ